MNIKQFAKIKKNVIKKLPWLKSVIFLSLLIYCGYLWYALIYTNQLSATEKESYINTKETGVKFDKDSFEIVLGKIEQRKLNYAMSIENIPDVFRFRQ